MVDYSVSPPAPKAVTDAPVEAFLSKLRAKISPAEGASRKFESVYSSLGAIADPALRMKSTLDVLKSTVGVDVQSVRAEYSLRRQRLDSEVSTFAGVMAAQRKTEITDRQANIDGIDKQIQDLSVERQSLASAIADAKTKLDRSQAGFDAAAETLRGEIAAAIENLKGENA